MFWLVRKVFIAVLAALAFWNMVTPVVVPLIK
jgi:hypothetical protein